MLTVFVFLGIMVIAMAALKGFVTRFLPDGGGGDAATIAVAIATAHDAQRKGRSQ